MNTYEFTVTLDRALEDDDYDRLFEAGLDDSSPGNEEGRGVIAVTREASTLTNAIISAFAQIEAAGLHVTGVAEDDLVTLKTIASRLGRSYESVRLLSQAKRGPGAFPAALSGDGWALYSWAAVSDWFATNYDTPSAVTEDSRVLAGVGYLLRARSLVDAPTFSALAALAH